MLDDTNNKILGEKNRWCSIEECCLDLNMTCQFSEMNNQILNTEPLWNTWGRGRPRPNISEICVPEINLKEKHQTTVSESINQPMIGRGRGFLAHYANTEDPDDVSKLCQISHSLNKLKANQRIPVSLQTIENHRQNTLEN